jgi:hypothetical protein
MDKKVLTIIILSVVIVVCLLVIGTTLFFVSGNITKLTQKNDVLIKENKDKDILYSNTVLEYAKKTIEYDKEKGRLDKEIADLKKQEPKIVMKETLVYLSSPEKDKLILDLQLNRDSWKAIVESQTILIDSILEEFKGATKDTLVNVIKNLKKTNKSLEESNNALKSIWYPHWGVSLVESATIDSGLNMDLTTNLIFKKYFFKGRLYFGGGLSFIYSRPVLVNTNNIGGGLNMELGFSL